MTENGTTTAVQQVETPDVSLQEWGKREDIAALSRRIRTMLPGGDKMQPAQAMALAQYAIAVDANPFRGEIYGFVSKGRFVLVDGYKLLVRWAKRQMPYVERYESLGEGELPQGAVGYRCWILRDDAKSLLAVLIQGGADWREAFDIAAHSAVGVVSMKDRTTKDGRPMDPPVGWTWDEVARKRALKNALNRSHGAPSPREISRESWIVEDTETEPEDWEGCTPNMTPREREATAEYSAKLRQMRAEKQPMSAEQAIQEVFEL